MFHRRSTPDRRSNRLAGRSPCGTVEITAWDVHLVFTDTDWRIHSCLSITHARDALVTEVDRLKKENWTVLAQSQDLARLYDPESRGQVRMEIRPR